MASHWQQQQQQQYGDEEDQMERPHMSSQDIQDTGEALEASPFTVSETFKKLDEGKGRVGVRILVGQQQSAQPQEDEDQRERPEISTQDIQDTGSALEPNPFTVSETFKKLDEGSAQSIFGGGATGRETVFKKVTEPQATLRGTEPANLKLCVICRGQLKGRFVKIREKGMHNECFTCGVCGDNLKGRGYFEQDSKFYCRAHRP